MMKATPFLLSVLTALAISGPVVLGEIIVHYNCEQTGSPLVDQAGDETAEANGTGLLYSSNSVPAGTYDAITLTDGLGYAVGITAGGHGSWNLDTTESAELGNLVNDFTVMAWVYIPVSGIGDDWPRMIGENANGGNGWSFGIDNKTGHLNAITLVGNGISGYYSTQNAVTNGGWQHVAATKSSTTGITFYHNGQPVSGSVNYSGATGNFNTETDIYGIGESDNGGADKNIEGLLMDEVRVYNEVLDATAIIAAAKAPIPAIDWSDVATTNITTTSAWAKATVDTSLTDAVLVWEETATSTDPGTGSTNDWTYRLGLGEQTAGDVTGQMTSLDADKEYVWRLYGATATTNGWSDAETFTTDLTDAQKPVFTNASTLSYNSIRLNWQDNASNESGYLLQRSETSGGTYTTITTLDANTTSYTNGGLTLSTTYYYRLAATNTANGSGTTPTLCQTNATTLGVQPVMITFATALSTPDYDLTGIYGIGDWAYWASTDDPATGTPSNEKTGIDLIGGMSTVGGGSLRGSTSDGGNSSFVFTDGTSPVSGTASNLLGLFNTQLGPSAIGNGVQLDILSPTADSFNIYVWATGYASTAKLTVDIGSATDVNSSSLVQGATRVPGGVYTITVDPDSIGQTVNLQLVVDTISDPGSGAANVSIIAVAVDTTAVIPPSGTVILIL